MIIVRIRSTQPYSRGFRFAFSVTWQVSWLSPKRLPSRSSQWLSLSFHNGDDSSGYCSGLTPDSLYTRVEHPVSPSSDAKLRIKNAKCNNSPYFYMIVVRECSVSGNITYSFIEYFDSCTYCSSILLTQ